MSRTTITAPGAPQAIGPYSHAVAVGDLLFCSGQTPIDPATGELIAGDIAQQTRRVLQNLELVLAASGATLAQAVKTTVFLMDMADFVAMNAVYAEFFPIAPPARSTVQVAGLPKGARVEIELVAVRSAS
ncbi:MAG: reactive intermediate/imine deaminase [Chloroflexales bacterium]|nr:reactive intermediate/imine deaminase [Chloroflexales bacterium]